MPRDICHHARIGRDRRRKTQIHSSATISPRDEVTAAVPAAFHTLPKGSTPIALRSPVGWWTGNPLTARVMANRLWEANIWRWHCPNHEEVSARKATLPIPRIARLGLCIPIRVTATTHDALGVKAFSSFSSHRHLPPILSRHAGNEDRFG